jgi:hypothetical protein
MNTIQELHIKTQLLFGALQSVPVGGEISYSDLNTAADIDTQADGRGYLSTARNKARRELCMVFGTIRGFGLKRLDDPSVVRSAKIEQAQGIRRISRKTVKTLRAVNYDALDREAKTDFNVTLSYAGVLGELAKEKSIARIEGAVRAASDNTVLPLKKTLEALGA